MVRIALMCFWKSVWKRSSISHLFTQAAIWFFSWSTNSSRGVTKFHFKTCKHRAHGSVIRVHCGLCWGFRLSRTQALLQPSYMDVRQRICKRIRIETPCLRLVRQNSGRWNMPFGFSLPWSVVLSRWEQGWRWDCPALPQPCQGVSSQQSGKVKTNPSEEFKPFPLPQVGIQTFRATTYRDWFYTQL